MNIYLSAYDYKTQADAITEAKRIQQQRKFKLDSISKPLELAKSKFQQATRIHDEALSSAMELKTTEAKNDCTVAFRKKMEAQESLVIARRVYNAKRKSLPRKSFIEAKVVCVGKVSHSGQWKFKSE